MEEKLENLALARRRLYSTLPLHEYEDENAMFKRLSHYEYLDRKSGDFPYDDDSVPSVRDFYAGKDILITGGTGFVGKVLVEKILRSLPEGRKIYLLIRGRKGLNPQQRVQAMLELPLFELVMTENPKAAERVVPIEGDCMSLGLGLSQTDRQTLIDNVSIVFHCAATVRFNLPFAHTILLNTRGTREVVHLCKALKKFDVFVHVSTAFTNATTDRTTRIPEVVLPACMDWRTAIAAAEKSSQGLKPDGFDLLFETLQTKHANTYTYSKLLAENLVDEECKDMPVVIVRPSVVIATYEDPFGGWVDNLYGPLSLWNGIGRGIIRAGYGIPSNVLDHLPVDYNIKTLITAAWHRGLGFRLSSDPEKVDVVNNSTGHITTVSSEKQNTAKQMYFDQNTHKYIFRYPRFYMTDRFWLFWLITVTSHLPLGIIIDTLLRVTGRKPILMDAYRRLYFAQANLLHFFCSREFFFEDKCEWKLDARIPKKDKPRFSFVTKLYETAYCNDNIGGVIKYVFKETPVKREESNMRAVLILDWISNAILAALGLWILHYFLIRG